MRKDLVTLLGMLVAIFVLGLMAVALDFARDTSTAQNEALTAAAEAELKAAGINAASRYAIATAEAESAIIMIAESLAEAQCRKDDITTTWMIDGNDPNTPATESSYSQSKTTGEECKKDPITKENIATAIGIWQGALGQVTSAYGPAGVPLPGVAGQVLVPNTTDQHGRWAPVIGEGGVPAGALLGWDSAASSIAWVTPNLSGVTAATDGGLKVASVDGKTAVSLNDCNDGYFHAVFESKWTCYRMIADSELYVNAAAQRGEYRIGLSDDVKYKLGQIPVNKNRTNDNIPPPPGSIIRYGKPVTGYQWSEDLTEVEIGQSDTHGELAQAEAAIHILQQATSDLAVVTTADGTWTANPDRSVAGWWLLEDAPTDNNGFNPAGLDTGAYSESNQDGMATTSIGDHGAGFGSADTGIVRLKEGEVKRQYRINWVGGGASAGSHYYVYGERWSLLRNDGGYDYYEAFAGGALGEGVARLTLETTSNQGHIAGTTYAGDPTKVERWAIKDDSTPLPVTAIVDGGLRVAAKTATGDIEIALTNCTQGDMLKAKTANTWECSDDAKEMRKTVTPLASGKEHNLRQLHYLGYGHIRLHNSQGGTKGFVAGHAYTGHGASFTLGGATGPHSGREDMYIGYTPTDARVTGYWLDIRGEFTSELTATPSNAKSRTRHDVIYIPWTQWDASTRSFELSVGGGATNHVDLEWITQTAGDGDPRIRYAGLGAGVSSANDSEIHIYAEVALLP